MRGGRVPSGGCAGPGPLARGGAMRGERVRRVPARQGARGGGGADALTRGPASGARCVGRDSALSRSTAEARDAACGHDYSDSRSARACADPARPGGAAGLDEGPWRAAARGADRGAGRGLGMTRLVCDRARPIAAAGLSTCAPSHSESRLGRPGRGPGAAAP
jgi:hypothetical protein